MSHLIFIHLPCPQCGQEKLPWRGWIVQSDFDEDGHAHNYEIDQMVCPTCGEIEFNGENDAALEALAQKIEEAFWSDSLLPSGSLYSYYPELIETGDERCDAATSYAATTSFTVPRHSLERAIRSLTWMEALALIRACVREPDGDFATVNSAKSIYGMVTGKTPWERRGRLD